MSGTIKVRIPVAIAPREYTPGKWFWATYSTSWNDDNKDADASAKVLDAPRETIVWVEAEIPIPDETVVTGTVTEENTP